MKGDSTVQIGINLRPRKTMEKTVNIWSRNRLDCVQREAKKRDTAVSLVVPYGGKT